MKNLNAVYKRDGFIVSKKIFSSKEIEFFNKKALTTTIPAQFVKRYNTKIIPVYIERTNEDKFNMKFFVSFMTKLYL